MDDRLEKSIEQIKFRQTQQLKREQLRLKIENQLIYGSNGGIFNIDQDLLSFVDILLNRGETEFVLLDQKNIPIYIVDLKAFSDEIWAIYKKSMLEYLADYTKLKRQRNVKSIVGMD